MRVQELKTRHGTSRHVKSRICDARQRFIAPHDATAHTLGHNTSSLFPAEQDCLQHKQQVLIAA